MTGDEFVEKYKVELNLGISTADDMLDLIGESFGLVRMAGERIEVFLDRFSDLIEDRRNPRRPINSAEAIRVRGQGELL